MSNAASAPRFHPMHSDPISIATSSILVPSLTPYGFSPFTNRVVAKIAEDILQLVMVDVSRRGNRWFGIEYASLCLFGPRDTMPLQPGGRLFRSAAPKTLWQRIFRIAGRQTGFPGSDIDEATASMTALVEPIKTELLPFFLNTNSVHGLCRHLETEKWGAVHHLNFEIGCCLARLGRYSEAETRVKKAAKLYEQDGRDWCALELQRCRSLLAAIAAGKAVELLDQWIEHSVAALGLHDLRAAQQSTPKDGPVSRRDGSTNYLRNEY